MRRFHLGNYKSCLIRFTPGLTTDGKQERRKPLLFFVTYPRVCYIDVNFFDETKSGIFLLIVMLSLHRV